MVLKIRPSKEAGNKMGFRDLHTMLWRTVVQGEGGEGDKDRSANNYCILSSCNLSERELCSTFAEVT